MANDRCLRFTRTAPGRFPTRRPALPQPLLHLTAGKPELPAPGAVPARTGLRAGDARPAAVVLDATGVRDVDGLAEVHAAWRPVVRSVAECGRVVVLTVHAVAPGSAAPPPGRWGRAGCRGMRRRPWRGCPSRGRGR
jgi:hypothetical protein